MEAKCHKCGCTNFFITEVIAYKAWTSDDDKFEINLHNKSCDIDYIECADCGEDLTELSVTAEIRFNFL